MRNRTDCFQSDLMYKVSSAFALTRCSITHTRRYHTRGGVPTHPSRSVCSIGTAHNRLSTSHHSEIHKSEQPSSICKLWAMEILTNARTLCQSRTRRTRRNRTIQRWKTIKDLPNDKLRAKLSGVLWFRRSSGLGRSLRRVCR